MSACRLCGTVKSAPNDVCPSCGKLDRHPDDTAGHLDAEADDAPDEADGDA